MDRARIAGAQGTLPPLVDDRPADGVFRVHREAFVNEELFELEMKHIFESTWNFLALESQVAKPNDFFSTWIGRTPVLVTRDAKGAVRAFVNVCRHKGSQVCRTEQGNAKFHVCPYHGWAYDSSGRNVDIKDEKAGDFGAGFHTEDHNLVELPRVGSYRGMVFGSLSAGVPSLEDYLGDFRRALDLTLDQGPKGMEVVAGRSVCSYRANWKLQLDNGIDFYHLTSTHASYMSVLGRRAAEKVGNQDARQFDWSKRFNQQGGVFGFDNGHSLVWLNQAQPENRAIYPSIGEVESRVGKVRADWVLKLRQTTFFPNMQISDSSATMLRVIRPITPSFTELRLYCFAPIGEPAATRTLRIRQFEDFFSASGFATPDDTATFEECQRGLVSSSIEWLQGYSRGMGSAVQGANDSAKELGVQPALSFTGAFDVQNELAFHATYREWIRLLQAGIEGRPAFDR